MISVSIVTVSHFNRIDFLKLLAKCIVLQDYQNIIEWVIVDTSKVGYYTSENDLFDTVEYLKKNMELPKIIYFKASKKMIGGWRNESMKLVSGDIIVCMDDDDYYPINRVSHAVEKISDKKTLIAGCDMILFYDIHFQKIYQYSGIFGPKHSTNNCMAFWREYLNNHTYDETVHHSEETSFTNNFSEPMTQLDPEKTVLQFSHDVNTYNKKHIIIQNYLLPSDKKYVIEKNLTVKQFINNDDIYDEYQKIFDELSKPKPSPYDIVYYCGISPIWSPLQNDLGGSEQAVKYLSAEWQKKGKKVLVYSNSSWTGNLDGVEYKKSEEFRFWDKFKTLIFWRMFGAYPYLSLDLKADKIIVDIHDGLDRGEFYIKHNFKINALMIKSEYHLNEIEKYNGQKKLSNAVVIPNGLRIQEFSGSFKESRNPFRLCYCSCYTRGLQRILNNIWPIIYELEPRAELHVYYGMNLITDETFREEMRLLLSQPGVMDHGRQPINIISREKHMATFHFYYSDSQSESDCITIRESLIAGCIPIISDTVVFKYRDGIHLKMLPNIPEFNKQIAETIVELMRNEKLQQNLQQQLSKSPTIISWEQCAEQWLKIIQ